MSERADRLGAAMLTLGLVREPAESALQALEDTPLLTGDEWDAWRALEPDDIALVHACLIAGFELRDRQWSALEAIGTAFAAGEGDTPEERIATMPADDSRRALLATYALGWNFPAPQGWEG